MPFEQRIFFEQNTDSGRSRCILRQYLKMHYLSPVQIVAVPKPAKWQSFLYHCDKDVMVTGPVDHRKTIWFLLEYPGFIWPERIYEIGLMCRNEDLRCVSSRRGMLAEFFRENFQKFMVETVFRFFNTYEWCRCRIFKHEKVRKDFQCAIRHLLGIERIIETFVVEADQQPAIRASFCIYLIDARDFPTYVFQNMVEVIRMFTFDELNHIA